MDSPSETAWKFLAGSYETPREYNLEPQNYSDKHPDAPNSSLILDPYLDVFLDSFSLRSFTDFDHLFDDAFHVRFWPSVKVGPTGCATTNTMQHLDSFRPRMDVRESKDANLTTATIELPGLGSEDVAIAIQQDCLTVSGESTAPHAHESGEYAVRERRYGKLFRTLQLPFGTKPEDVNAKMENGLLTITFPKTNHEQQPRRIAIQ